ncbi:MAG: hypothetical protein CMP08_03740 [Xanthomonadales bacterium]|nr:hypothetical protein [Xanthomonadales bacterium]
MASSQSDDPIDDDALAAFIALADYEVPSMPTRDAFSTWWTRLREMIRRKPAEPMIANDRLRRSTLERLDEIASPPACGPLVAELEATLADWPADPNRDLSHQLIVLPPGDRNHVITAWARAGGHEVLAPPARDDIIGANAHDLPLIEESDRLLVVAALEDWFVRDLHGLALVRALLDRLDRLKRPAVVGCNSWAWQYLVRAVQADAILPTPIIFKAFDATRLKHWLGQIAEHDGPGTVAFRDAESGDDIMADDDNGKPHDVLENLAAHSRGIPWVAWRLWRRSLRRRAETEQDNDGTSGAANDDTGDRQRASADQTLWVIALEEFLLPDTDNAPTLLLLQALLIHGRLPQNLLARTVPEPHAQRLLPALISAGIVEADDDRVLTCAPAAYPSIRAALSAAGFPIASV